MSGQWLDLMILCVFYNLNDSMVLPIRLWCWHWRILIWVLNYFKHLKNIIYSVSVGRTKHFPFVLEKTVKACTIAWIKFVIFSSQMDCVVISSFRWYFKIILYLLFLREINKLGKEIITFPLKKDKMMGAGKLPRYFK